MHLAAHAAAVAGGLAVVLAVFASALRTVVIPRAIPARLTRWVVLAVRRAYLVRLGKAPSYQRRDEVMTSYPVTALMLLLATWVTLVLLAFWAVHWGLGEGGAWQSLLLSGSSLFTLGFVPPRDHVIGLFVFLEAGLGLVLLALLITYLPSLYGIFSRREAYVAKLTVRAGRPPSGVELLQRAARLERMESLEDLWLDWETFFTEAQETHTSFPVLPFFRSPHPDESWVTASGAVLDAAALRAAAVDLPRSVEAELMIRAGYLALGHVARFYGVPAPLAPAPDDPISVSRVEFDDALGELAEAGVPLRADRDRAWRDWAGWRVNYDVALVALATLVMAPTAPWSADRSLLVSSRPRSWSRRMMRDAR